VGGIHLIKVSENTQKRVYKRVEKRILLKQGIFLQCIKRETTYYPLKDVYMLIYEVRSSSAAFGYCVLLLKPPASGQKIMGNGHQHDLCLEQYGRRWGKTRSWMGENTVVDGGNLTVVDGGKHGRGWGNLMLTLHIFMKKTRKQALSEGRTYERIAH
jgi:hypothetical protein